MPIQCTVKPAVAVDLDGVLATYDGWKSIHEIGEPIPGAVRFVQRLCERFHVVVHTCRTATGLNYHQVPADRRGSWDQTGDYLAGLVRAWLFKHGFPPQVQVWSMPGKPLAVAYIDDRAYRCVPQIVGQEAYQRAAEFLEQACPSVEPAPQVEEAPTFRGVPIIWHHMFDDLVAPLPSDIPPTDADLAEATHGDDRSA